MDFCVGLRDSSRVSLWNFLEGKKVGRDSKCKDHWQSCSEIFLVMLLCNKYNEKLFALEWYVAISRSNIYTHKRPMAKYERQATVYGLGKKHQS